MTATPNPAIELTLSACRPCCFVTRHWLSSVEPLLLHIMTPPPSLPNATNTRLSMFSGIFAAAIALPFFVYLCSAYAATPSDPQKAIGYIFIALYCAVVAAFGFALARLTCSIPRSVQRPMQCITFCLLAAACAVALLLMIVRHPS
jgi:hypothetical protein